jgi:ABC-type nitrate/sulfonate/bicarbonate transport system, permease component
VVIELQRMLESGRLWQELGISLLRITLGFLLGGLLGVALGLLIGISTTASALLRPIITAINPIPKILLIPFVVLAFGFNEQARVLSLAFSILPILLLDAAAAVYRIDPKYFEVARSYGASRWDEFWTVALPAALPSIMNSLKLGLAYSMTLIVGVELFGARSGIGKFAWDAANIYAVNRLGAGIVAIAITGWLLSLLIDLITPNLIAWQPRPTEVRVEESRCAALCAHLVACGASVQLHGGSGACPAWHGDCGMARLLQSADVFPCADRRDCLASRHELDQRLLRSRQRRG